MEYVAQWLNMGSDVATIGLFMVWWRFDRRIYRVELNLGLVK